MSERVRKRVSECKEDEEEEEGRLLRRVEKGGDADGREEKEERKD